MTRFLSVMLGSACLFLVVSCQKDDHPRQTGGVRVNAATAAIVNGERISASEVELEAASQGLLEPGQTLSMDDPVFDQVLQQLIDQKLLAQEALNRAMDQDADAQHRLQAARERILGNILVENLVSEEVDEAAILKMYEEQTQLQQLGEEVLIRHILVNTKEEADQLYQQLRGGAEFAELAFNHSIDRETNAEGGLIDYVLPDAMGEPFASVINKTPVGAISEPFESDYGWHIIKVDDRRTEEPPTLEETRPKIVQFLTLTEISKLLKELRVRADIETVTDGDGIELPESILEDETYEELGVEENDGALPAEDTGATSLEQLGSDEPMELKVLTPEESE